MRPSLRRLAALTAVTVVTSACAGVVAVQRVDELTGEWKGRRFGPVGNAPAALTIADNGAYKGVAFLDAGDRAFHGALVVVRPGQIRYQGSEGTGAVRVSGERGQRVLRFLRDDGGIDAVFRESAAAN